MLVGCLQSIVFDNDDQFARLRCRESSCGLRVQFGMCNNSANSLATAVETSKLAVL